MSDDSRCCGTGTCIINAEGLCWCGHQWDMPPPKKQDTALTEIADARPAPEAKTSKK